ncbi:MAG: flagellar assembly protein FliX [Alphaproteobacteria bacterium]|nr:flagellar assembly protein FliX [Alphaproteobacteria bacterium]
MKVDPTKISGVTQAKRAKKASSTGGPAFADMISDTEATERTSGPAPASGVESVFAVQSVGDREGNARKAKERAELMLSRLEDLRDGLLMGMVPMDRLHDLATAARQQREEIDDPRLSEILDDIELRARVELAKLGRSV